MEELSIIIPTYNRIEILKKVLDSLNNQDYDMKKTEVLVIDDCSKDNPLPELKKIKTRYKLRLFRMQINSGQGNVRNKAIKLAKAKYLLFIGDDTIPRPDLISQHMKMHQENKDIAVLGNVVWSKEVRNRFMDYIEKIQFHYNNIKDINDVKLHFYTSNISLEKKWFDDEEYSPRFKNYGFEDLELGYRLEKKGLRVIYNASAIVNHLHTYTFEQFCTRMFNVGKSAVIFSRLHPELRTKYIPRFFKIIKIGSFILSYKMFYYINKKIYWYSNFVYQYIKGIEFQIKEIQTKQENVEK